MTYQSTHHWSYGTYVAQASIDGVYICEQPDTRSYEFLNWQVCGCLGQSPPLIINKTITFFYGVDLPAIYINLEFLFVCHCLP